MKLTLIRPIALAISACLALTGAAHAEFVVRIAMTAADIPRTLGQPDQGFEGNRFTGLTMYEGLTGWDLSSAEKPSAVIPLLATEWKVDAADKTKWIFKLRSGVKFHDGSEFDADAVVWNVAKALSRTPCNSIRARWALRLHGCPTLRCARKIDEMTVELTTTQPDSFLPINLTNLFMASPANWQKLYDAMPANVTDPKQVASSLGCLRARCFRHGSMENVEKFVPRERLELVKNTNYWDKARIPKVDKIVLALPMPGGERPHRGACSQARSTG